MDLHGQDGQQNRREVNDERVDDDRALRIGDNAAHCRLIGLGNGERGEGNADRNHKTDPLKHGGIVS